MYKSVKILVVSIIISLVLAVLPKTNVYASADVTAPTIDVSTLQVDKTTATIGDSIKVSLKVSDDMSGIYYVKFYFIRPVTNDTYSVQATYDSVSDTYYANINITNNTESGIWKLASISTSDNNSNYIEYDNQDLYTYSDTKMDFSNGTFEVYGTGADVTAPTIDVSTLKVDKTTATIGERVKVSIKVSDDMSGIYYVFFDFRRPVTNDTYNVSATYDSVSDTYYAYINITDNTVSGIWQLASISTKDKNSNFIEYKNQDLYTYSDTKMDLSQGTFEIYGTDADVTPPSIDLSTLQVDKTSATIGERVKVSIKVTDDMSGIYYVFFDFRRPVTNDTYSLSATYDSASDTYYAYINITDNTVSGIWQLASISTKDKNSNYIEYKNQDLYTYSKNKVDLSKATFEVTENQITIPSLDNVNYVTENSTWSNKTVDGDLYIGPNAVLTVNGNVRVNGNIYVLGALKSYGGLSLSGTLYGTNTAFGYNTTLYNGTIVLYGSNSISSMTMSNRPISSIPIRIDTKDFHDGVLDLSGATIPVVDLYIDGQPLNLNYNGTFELNNFVPVHSNYVEIEFRTVFGYSIFKRISKPSLIGPTFTINKPLEINLNSNFNPLDGVSASDSEDGDLTKDIVVTSNNVDPKKLGTYTVTYKVVDSDLNETTKTITISVVAPILQNQPEVNTFSDLDTTLIGKTLPNMKVKAYIDQLLIATTTSNSLGEFSFDLGFRVANTTISIIAYDNFGNSSKTTNVIVEDQSVPQITAATEVGNIVIDHIAINQNVVVTTSEGTLSVTKNGAAYTWPNNNTFTSDGEYVVTAMDNSNHQTLFTFTIDKTKPKISVVDTNGVSISNNGKTNKNVVVSYNEGTIEVYKDGMNDQYVDKFTSEGKYYIRVVDQAGNQSEYNFVIDKTGPVIEVKSVEGFYYNNNSYINRDVKVTITEGSKSVTLDGKTIAWPSTNTFQNGGKYVVTAKDSLGNVSTFTFTIDKIPPKITVKDINGTLLKNGNEVNKDVIVTTNEGTLTFLRNSTSYKWPTTNKFTEDGYYWFQSIDKAGNITNFNLFITKNPPVIIATEITSKQIIKNNGYANEKVNITFKMFSGSLEVKRNGQYYTWPSYNTFSSDGKYVVKLTNSFKQSSTLTFTVDKTKPTVGIKTTSGTSLKSGSYTKSSVVVTYKDTNYSSKSVTKGGVAYTWPTNNTFTSSGKYVVTVKDKAGNVSTVTFIIDKVVPKITAKNSSGISISNGGSTTKPVTITVTEVNLKSKTVTKNGVAITWPSTNTFTAKGTYVVTVKDRAGNLSTYKFTIK